MHSVVPGVWRENGKACKMRNTHFMTWNISRNTQKYEK